MRRIGLCFLLAGTCLSPALVASPASAAKYEVLYSFCHGNRFVCSDGKTPGGNLVADDAGNLYGTTTAGGSTGNGVIFELVRKNKEYKYRVLHSFDGAAEGGVPITAMILDTAGNLYGTAVSDGSDFGGTAFELSPNADRSQWNYKVIMNFCSQNGPQCLNGMVPESPLTYAGSSSGAPYDGVSPLYGTTLEGNGSAGIAYQLVPSGGNWTGSVLYSFCALEGCADGGFPVGQLGIDPLGKRLYGTANEGGTSGVGAGVVYSIAIATGVETVLHSFCTSPDCADGNNPVPGVTLADNNHLFGATSVGGKEGSGTLYELNIGKQKEKILYSFCRKTGCADGIGPAGPVVQDGGSLIGSAGGGDGGSNGVIYRVGVSNDEDVLYTFCQQANCTDGSTPVGAITNRFGVIFGVTQRGGNKNDGVVFRLVP